ncbi:hypothetical protein ACRQ1B_03240 [Rhizobium panacihumi]
MAKAQCHASRRQEKTDSHKRRHCHPANHFQLKYRPHCPTPLTSNRHLMRMRQEGCVRSQIFSTEFLGPNARRKISLDDGVDGLLTGAIFEKLPPHRQCLFAVRRNAQGFAYLDARLGQNAKLLACELLALMHISPAAQYVVLNH